MNKKLEWKSKYIYWHKVIYVDSKRIKQCMKRPYKVGQLVGFCKIEKQYETFDDKNKDITPYIIFKFVGKTLYSKNQRKRMVEFKKFENKLKEKK